MMMMRRAFTSALHRRAWQSSLVAPSTAPAKNRASIAALIAASTAVAGGLVLTPSQDSGVHTCRASATLCEFRENVIHVANDSSETERFEQCLEYHRCFLADYKNRWDYSKSENKPPATSSWPLYVPEAHEVPSLEVDWSYCHRSSEESSNRYCDDLQFRLATFYLRHYDPKVQRKGFKMVKQLAEKGHGDGMCMYGVVLNEGSIVEADPTQAAVWWQRAVDMHRHVASTYEIAVSFYTGEGVAENEELAVYYFEKAATLGHAGAAYMLGDCLLDGVGAPRDRAEALEWLVAAGELGHRGARSRVLAVLEGDGSHDKRFTDSSRQTLVEDVDEETKWHDLDDENVKGPQDVSIERRFTIGGGSRNPVVLARRRTVVANSRTP